MPQFIYKSEFNTGPEATKRQQLLFEADLKFAIESDYSYIQDSSGTVFQINSPTELVEVDTTEEELQRLFDDHTADTDKPDEDDDTVSYCLTCHNLLAIDQIINNTLLRSGKISTESCDNMLKLAQLRILLSGNH
jgi:hypothetical protein